MWIPGRAGRGMSSGVSRSIRVDFPPPVPLSGLGPFSADGLDPLQATLSLHSWGQAVD